MSGQASSISDSLLVVITLVVWSVVLDALAYRWPWAHRLLTPPARALIREGTLDLRVARRELLTCVWSAGNCSPARIFGLSFVGKVSLISLR